MAGNKWACLSNPEIVLDFSQVNDNYCDCPDGSDEPGTSLCSTKGRFYCENKGHFPNYIPSSQVDDGVCDYELCCDGSDENGTVSCPNRCEELHKKYEEDKLEREKIIKNGLAKKATLEKLVIEEKDKIKTEIENLNKDLANKKDELQVLRDNYNPSEDDDDSNSLMSKVSPYLTKIKDKFTLQASAIEDLEGKINNLESILEKLSSEYNPNFNDLAVKEGIKNFQDYIVNKETQSYKDNDDSIVDKFIEEISQIDISIDTPVVHEAVSFFDALKSKVEDTFYQFIGLEPPSPPETSSRTTYKGSKGKQIEELESEIQKLSEKITSETEELNSSNYGPGDILRSYKDKCVTKKYGEYDYKYCFTGTITQQGNGNNVVIGKYSRSLFHDDDFYLIFDNGARCWNGPIRQGTIKVECGEEDELISVTEPEVCLYHFKVKSPIACFEIEEEKTKHLKDEL